MVAWLGSKSIQVPSLRTQLFSPHPFGMLRYQLYDPIQVNFQAAKDHPFMVRKLDMAEGYVE